MKEKNIITEIVEKRKKDAEKRGFCFGIEIPQKRTRPVNPFMQEKGVILEIKRASPSKGDIAPKLNAAETAIIYASNKAQAISCLTEENYFKGSLKDLIEVCKAVPDTAVLRKDFLTDEEEIEISYLCGADAVLLISGILTKEKLISMTAKCRELGIKALVEIRTEEDAEKVLEVKKQFADTIVCGINSRNLKDFSVDLLVPAMLKNKLGGKVIFESGITTCETASKIASMGFTGILLGEGAARNPENTERFVNAFMQEKDNLYGRKLVTLAERISRKNYRPMVKICGLTECSDVLLADSLGTDFVGFIFADGFKRNVYGSRFDEIQKILNEVKAFKVAVITETKSKEAEKACKLVKDGILDFIQLHGIPFEAVPSEIKKLPHFFAVTDKTEAGKLSEYGESRFIQDIKNHDYENKGHLWISGNITCENVEQLISHFHPELVDVSSGTEGEFTGIKDSEKLSAFIKKVTGEKI